MRNFFSKKSTLHFILLLGIVSLFADITYEGARSIIGPFLSFLGASSLAVGVTMGLGEWTGYSLRAVSGYFADKKKKYWTFTIIGYVINLLALPLLAFVSSWQMAAFLIILERLGKSIRVPARDAMLSFAAKEAGRGKGFGLHESIDQIGAVLGPLIVSALLFLTGRYQLAFLFLLIPALFSLLFLLITRFSYPKPHAMEAALSVDVKGFSLDYWLALLACGFIALGFVDFALVAYHFNKISLVSPTVIPLFYAIAMTVDGLSALVMGPLFDRKGFPFLALITALSSLFAPLVFLGNAEIALLGIILWGIGMASQESIMKALIAGFVSPKLRATGFGLFHLVFGSFWAIGSILIGWLYAYSLLTVVLFSLIAQLASLPFFFVLHKRKNT